MARPLMSPRNWSATDCLGFDPNVLLWHGRLWTLMVWTLFCDVYCRNVVKWDPCVSLRFTHWKSRHVNTKDVEDIAGIV